MVAATALVGIAKPAEEVAPAATGMVAGTVTTVGSDAESATAMPPAGAGPSKYKREEMFEPPFNVAGEARNELSATGRTVSEAVFVTDPYVALMVTTVLTVTDTVEIVKLGEVVAPAGTTAEAGTDATAGLELDRPTVMPAGGAGPFNVTRLYLAETGPTTDTGLTTREVSTIGFTVNVAGFVTPP